MTEAQTNDTAIAELTAEVVSAYVGNNPVPAGDLPALIGSVHAALIGLGGAVAEDEKPEPAVNPKRSVRGDHIICLECGGKFKSLKRHLASHHGMTPDEYRARWGLAADYPMVAPDYAAQRSELAKSMGLGRKARKTKSGGKKK
ncbi:MAG: MucR family transcriptional regulator [Rhizobiaceae bacterium]|nr:MucR family transcriptional regulator [Rhizobiaceae bacterium]